MSSLFLEAGNENQPQFHHARPLLPALLEWLSNRYGDSLNLCPVAKEAIIAAVAQHNTVFRWL